MNQVECFSAKLSSRTLGIVILPLALFLGFVGAIVLPIVGGVFALPLLIMSGVLVFAPESKACRLITEKGSSR
ncbi:MAG: hypothetical protein P8Y38_06795 [Deltaproteobacteria bacterium]|jgi:hypothetical protein